jgi:hypothetical protein
MDFFVEREQNTMTQKQQEHQPPLHALPLTDEVLSCPWTPFVRCEPDPGEPETDIWLNSRYQAHLRRHESRVGGPTLVHLSFKRLDRGHLIQYRDKMRIKDELVGAECEGIELLPARSREVDTANQYHLWIIADEQFRFPLGFPQRCVSDASIDGSVQEPWPEGERPADCLSAEALAERIQSEGTQS